MADEPTPPASAAAVTAEDRRQAEPIETPVVANTPAGWLPPTRSTRMTATIVAMALVGIFAVLYAWGLPPFTSAQQTTDNAYVRGQTTLISPQVTGYVTQVTVQDYQQVKAGQVLARIDDAIYRQRVQQAEANLAAQIANLANSAQTRNSRAASETARQAEIGSAEAQLARARADMARVDDLVADGSVSLRERDQTRAALLQAQAAVAQARAGREIARQDVRSTDVNRGALEAAVEQARAALELAKIDLGHTVIVAPRDGQLGAVGVRVGQYVTSGSQLTYLVPDTLWVTANYKEGQTARMAPGQRAWFDVDGLEGARVYGRLAQIAPATGSEFAVLKSDNATGNFVKVAQRISVRISIDPRQELAKRLRPGMSVEATVDTASGPVR
ncbi:MAG: HlyD family secretion protein [Candidatus Andeanibacterium colombiense]|uniref:HlyD family secretion protein n=1 Tax=Candidatus Andeanibacterium colombiense TaxID=3121345 RepID=A0AAJ5X5W5_9SPHN|nr:MAG: HlyD family secretion protein [Sphingomonadaceae bacterium]